MSRPPRYRRDRETRYAVAFSVTIGLAMLLPDVIRVLTRGW